MARFADALKTHEAPAALGDVALRYEPSMLIGETPKRRRTWRPTLAWLAGFSLLLFSMAALVLGESPWGATALILTGAAAIAAAVRLERDDVRQRRFVANFATYSLRLDFSSPIVGRPRTLVVPFDAVKAVVLLEQGGGLHVLVVDFEHEGSTLREALAAFIPEGQREGAERLERVLKGAFGLGEVPADSPIHGYGETSSFE